MKKPTRTQAPRGNQGDTPTPRVPAKRRLKSASDLRLFLGDVLNRVNRNELDPATGRTLAYIGQVLAGIISASDIETRLAALEAQAQEKKR